MQTGRNNDIAARILGFLVTLLGSGWLALQLPQVQTGLAEKALQKLDAMIPGRIQIGSVSIEPVNSFQLTDVVIIDDNPFDSVSPIDTFFVAKSISGKISLKSLLGGGGVSLSRVRLDDAMMHLALETDSTRSSGSVTNLERIFGMPEPPEREGYLTSPDIFEVEQVEVNGFRYRMTDYIRPAEPVPGSINWSDLDVLSDIRAHNLKYTGGRMSGIVDSMNCREKCGYSFSHLSGRARVGMGKATVDRIHLVDEWSDAHFGLYSMAWNSVKYDFADFLNRIRIEGTVGAGTVSLNTIRAFSGAQLPDITLLTSGGHVEGYVNDFKVNHLKVKEPSSGMVADVSATLTGLTDVGTMLTDARIHNMTFTTAGAGRLIEKLGADAPIEGIAPGRVFSFSGRAKGPLGNLHASGNLGSRIGRATFNVAVRNLLDSRRPLEIVGSAGTRNLALNEFTGTDAIGECTANAGLRLSVGSKGPSVTVDSLLIDKLSLLGYDYTGMKLSGSYSPAGADLRFLCGDPNLNIMLGGSAAFSPVAFDIKGNIGYADLNALGFDKRGKSLVSAGISGASHSGRTQLTLKDVCLENEIARKELGDILLEAGKAGDAHSLELHAGFADASFRGNKDLPSLISDLVTLTVKRELPALFKEKTSVPESYPQCEARLDFHDTRDLLTFIMPGLYMADSTRVSLGMDGNGSLEASIGSPRLAWKTNYLKGVTLSFDNRDESLNALLVSSEMSIGGIGFSNAALTGYARSNSFFTGFSYDGIHGIDNVGELYLTGELARTPGDSLMVSARPLSSFIRFAGEQWDLDESLITLKDGMIRIDGFSIHNGSQYITLDGGASMNRSDTLRLGLSNVDLSVINYFTKGKYDIHGRTGGRAILTSPIDESVRAIASLECDSLQIGGIPAGSLRAGAYWNRASDKVNMILKNSMDGNQLLSATGTFHPQSSRLEMDADLNGMNLVIAQPFVADFLSEISGGMRGNLTASGPLDSLQFSSRGVALDNVRIGVAATGVAYNLNGPMSLDNEGLHFDGVSITDDKGGSGSLFGGVGIRGLNRIMLGAGLRMRRLELLDIGGSEGLRGNLFASGQVYVSGPPEAILLDADVTTAGDGNLHIPLSNAISASRSDLLTFTSHEVVYKDPYEDVLAQLLEQRKRKTEAEAAENDFIARIRITTTPELLAALELDNTGDNLLRFRGDGVIGLNLRPSKDVFEISGDYSIGDGDYRFAIPGIVSKDFTIDPGSSITFGGDILESVLDIGATYSLRTSLNRLLADTTSVSTRRSVNCGIHISDRLAAPSVSFSIDVPDLDPSTKSEVEGALNTEDKIQKQFVALLVTGSFIPNEQSGIVNNPNILYSNVSEIMSQQLSNILSRLEIPLDMGLGYQQNSQGTDLFDVAVRTELFNNRVEVNGSVGNRQSTTGANAYGDVVGDLDIDIKLDKPGQLRLNLFSHSADEYTAYLDNTQRNGGGITYQKEFNTWREFLRNIFSSRKKREERAAQAAAPAQITTKVDE